MFYTVSTNFYFYSLIFLLILFECSVSMVKLNNSELRYNNWKKNGKQSALNKKNYYTSWSRWSPCTRSCTTHRHRWCRKPGLCGRDAIRQNAYCFVENSFCQKWIQQKILNGQNYNTDDFNGIENVKYSKNDNWKCGLIDKSKNQDLSYLLKIIGGHPTAAGQWPWQVALLNKFREAFCGGTLISSSWILTAAHCIRKHMFVRIGEHDLTVKEGTEIEFKVDVVKIHPNYNADTVDNDVALIRLPVRLKPTSSNYGIACLPLPKQPLPVNQLCTIIGWGKSRPTNDFGTDVLHEARIPIVPSEVCKTMYSDYKITNNMFCAGYQQGRMDSCAGDSGGPLLCRDLNKSDHPWTIFGITSFGEGCGKRGKFGIYARLSNYVKWITNSINDKNNIER